jgi:hypothetical protein
MVKQSLSQGGYMRNSKSHWILAAAIAAASVFFYACPTEEEQPPAVAPDDDTASANATLALATTALTNASVTEGKVSGTNVEFTVSGVTATELPTGQTVEIKFLVIDTVKYSQSKSFTSNGGGIPATFTLSSSLDNFIETGAGASNISSIGFTYQGKSTLASTPGTVSAELSKSVTNVPTAIAGTINALRSVAQHFLPIGKIINSGAGTVDTVNAGSAGTLLYGDSQTGVMVSPVSSNGLDVSIVLPSSTTGGSIAVGSVGTIEEWKGGSITTGSVSGVQDKAAGSFAIHWLETSSVGTLALRDTGSLSVEGGGSGLATVYFGSTSTTKAKTSNLVLTAGGIEYIVPQFGVLVTLYR